ncbi:hypothetical protein K432DRAFT_405865 [Lepidopterella palustris CBS 459.81]|uniref:Uncharacterized protein n=1 Tax=Lepidopterella palustris CBS 459.81 TaxID=1314670 RepID=A0A8E2JE32_9PEZI|nr:hypothetical protein K432DRAFT_405865 [Lepidopterella palustris CBS 459.81]
MRFVHFLAAFAAVAYAAPAANAEDMAVAEVGVVVEGREAESIYYPDDKCPKKSVFILPVRLTFHAGGSVSIAELQ